MSSPKTVYLIDGSSFLYRAFYALKSLTAPDGTPVNAVYGFCRMLKKLIEQRQPAYLAVVWDSPGPTARHVAYPAYKATRQAAPNDLFVQKQKIQEFLELIGVYQVAQTGVEADDLIGSLAQDYAEQGAQIVIVSSDKDLYQLLINPKIILWDTFKDLTTDAASFQQRQGFPVTKLDFYHALIGDASDNIPGVRGIGPKGALALVQQFDSLAQLYANLDRLTSTRLQAALQAQQAAAELSLELFQLQYHDLQLPLSALQFDAHQWARASDFFSRLNFKSLLGANKSAVSSHTVDSRPTRAAQLSATNLNPAQFSSAQSVKAPPGQQSLFGANHASAPTVSAAPNSGPEANSSQEITLANSVTSVQPAAAPFFAIAKNYQFKAITTLAELETLCEQLALAPAIAIDTELTGLQPLQDRLVGISICAQPGTAYYIPLAAPANVSTSTGNETGITQLAMTKVSATDGTISPDLHQSAPALLSLELVRQKLAPILTNPKIAKYLHHAKFDQLALGAAGLALTNVTFDTCLAASLVLEGRGRASLKFLSQHYLQETMLSYDEVVTAHKLADFSQVPLPLATQYAAADAHQTFALVPILTQALAQQDLTNLYQQIELPLISVLLAMEQTGIYLDPAALAELGAQVTQALTDLLAKISAIAELPATFNLNSPQQVAELLFTKLQLPAPKKLPKSGQLATDQSVLARLAKIHPVPSLILKYRELYKLKTTYIDQLPTYINPQTKKIHTSFSQIITATGRLASAEPNLQNIPAAAGFGRQVRAAFKPDQGDVFLAADYSQIELRVLAHLSGDQQLQQAFLTGVDIHQQTAAKLFGVASDAVTNEQRQIGKRINFSVLYGLTPYGLAQDLELSLKSAKQYIEAYFASYPEVAAWMERTVATATAQGYVTTYWGRRRAIPALQERNQTLYNAGRRLAINTPVQGTAAEIMKLGMLAVDKQLKQAGLGAKILLQIHDELLLMVPMAELAATKTLVKTALETVVDWSVPLVVSLQTGADWAAVTK